MQLTLTAEEAQLLARTLEAYLPGLRRELAHTDINHRDLKHELALRVDLCERLITQLGTGSPPTRTA